jgi:hypothetical protein
MQPVNLERRSPQSGLLWVRPYVKAHPSASGVCFDKPSLADPTLWFSDQARVWADLDIGAVRG